jgi:signal transduction histidine kinase
VLLEALNEMYGKLGDKNLELMQLNQKLAAEHEALRQLNEELEQRVSTRTSALAESNQRLLESNVELTRLNDKLEAAHSQLLQSEKLAAIGQLAAGIAHEINNPIGFINANLGMLDQYLADLFLLIAAYEQAETGLTPAARQAIGDVRSRIDLAYLRGDVPNLMKESLDGLGRVKCITQDLMDFSRVGESTWQLANIEKSMDSTLNVVWNEVKHKADVVKKYGEIP